MINWRGLYALFAKEVKRFVKVTMQTVFTPAITAILYLLVFAQVLSDHVQVYAGVSYVAFLIPGLMMMSVIQNAFANSSSSLIQSKMTGNLVFVLLSPISNLEFFLAFVAAAVVRGILVAMVVYVAALFFVELPVYNLALVMLFAVLSSAVLGALGVLAGIWAEKYDQLAAFQNFLILPLSFLSGAFYSIYTLPEVWQWISHLNPFFYMIDGFRYGFFGASDVSPLISFSIITVSLIIVSGITLFLLHKGYKIRG